MNLLFVLAAVILATKLCGEIAQRLRRPAMLGELVAGVVLGAGALGVYDPQETVLHAFAQLGVLVLLFQIGLGTDLRSLRTFAKTALTVATTGMLLPFAGGLALARALGIGQVAGLVMSAALTPTSVGISARLLHDLGRLDTDEGQVVLGAAIFDDIIGLIILSVISVVLAGGAVSWMYTSATAGIAVGFVVLALAMGSVAMPPLFRAVERARATGALGLIALAFALALAWLAAKSGSASIIGACASCMGRPTASLTAWAHLPRA